MKNSKILRLNTFIYSWICVSFLFMCTGMGACSITTDQQNNSTADDRAVITLIDSSTYDFGEVGKGQIVEHTFQIRNDATHPIVISKISSSCGCTTPVWPQDPIPPGSTANISVRFDTNGKAGPQLKSVTVFTDAVPAQFQLYLRGFIDPAKAI